MAKILVVDDSQVDRLLISGLVQHGAHQATSAGDGNEALELLRRDPFDLVITDLVMPQLDGLGLVEALRQHHPHTPAILVTARGGEEIAVRALRAGAASYVPKAQLDQELLSTIDDVLLACSEDQYRRQILGCLQESDWCFELPNDRRLFEPLIRHLLQYLAEWCGEGERTRLAVALQEALTNAAEHGNLEMDSDLRRSDRVAYYHEVNRRLEQRPYRERPVRVVARLSQQEARFEIRDRGPGFDPAALPDPTQPDNVLRTTGRGIYLMRMFMDEVRFNAAGNEVTLIKRPANGGAARLGVAAAR